MAKRDFDVCVIGAGPAGFAAAMRCWDFGKRVCIVERGNLGGAGVHDGALSSKTLWELSKDYRGVLRRDRGYAVEKVNLSFQQVIACVKTAVDEKTAQIAFQLQELARPHSEHGGCISLLQGAARFLDPHSVQINCTDPSENQVITADNFVIATGSRPRTLPHIAVDGNRIMTSDHIMKLDRFPESIVILGAGVVGCEFATIFANYGKTKIYIIDRAERILPFEDEDIARLCAKNLEKKGVTIHHKSKLLSMEVVNDKVVYTLEHPGGGTESIEVDHALVSIGRVPNCDQLGLSEIGVELSVTGHITHKNTITSVPHIYAVGDVTLDIALVSIGEIEGRHAAERICNSVTRDLSYDNLSTIMFLDPEVAAIGLNELQAQAAKIPYKVATYGYPLVNRAIAMRATGGFVKLLVTDDDSLTILGMRALGEHASTMIEAASLLIQQDRSAEDLAELIHPHPAITECLQECVRMMYGKSIYKPDVFKQHLRLSGIGYKD